MPKIPNIGMRDLRMDPALYGAEGESSMAGLMMHEASVDMSLHPSLSSVTYDIFAPLSSIAPLVASKPLFVWFAAFRWELGDTRADATTVSLGGNAATYNNLIPANSITQASQETKGFRVFDQGAILKVNAGTTPHDHWVPAKTIGSGSTLTLPIRAVVDATTASMAAPYSGSIYFYILLASITETLPEP